MILFLLLLVVQVIASIGLTVRSLRWRRTHPGQTDDYGVLRVSLLVACIGGALLLGGGWFAGLHAHLALLAVAPLALAPAAGWVKKIGENPLYVAGLGLVSLVPLPAFVLYSIVTGETAGAAEVKPW